MGAAVGSVKAVRNVAVIDYRCGNLKSVINGLRCFDVRVDVVSDPNQLAGYDQFILPGVGAFGPAIERLRSSGMSEALDLEARQKGKPILGICLGMQLLCSGSEEGGQHQGLGWVEADVRSLRELHAQAVSNNLKNPHSPNDNIKVPHMGWNSLHFEREHPLLNGLVSGTDVYFVHSFAVQCHKREQVLASCHHGSEFVAMFAKDNIVGMQFHPEKSHKTGLTLLKNFTGFGMSVMPAECDLERAVC